MLLHLYLFLGVTASLTLLLARPISVSNDVHGIDAVTRHGTDFSDFNPGFTVRALTLLDSHKHANAVLHAQQSKKALHREKKAAKNKKATCGKTTEHEKQKAISSAQKAAKEACKERWEKKPKTTPKGTKPKTPKVKLTAEEKQQVKDVLHTSVSHMRNTVGILATGQYRVKSTPDAEKYMGKSIQTAVMNSYINDLSSAGLGNAVSKHPKLFQNRPYDGSHPDGRIRNQHPIPGNLPNLKEYPLKKIGWTGTGNVGPVRVITLSHGGTDMFHAVIGHNISRGGNENDHYCASRVAREADELD
ncbi:unnamed protein product [Cyclocybe aegerita]|uniref:Uncharacterized protein n=1 Tax=Cyclocybe aegerita TaxID=1973307 RepID=A0A8S0XHE0_CYCAE|nr:unnamed protein product [Cyclocybe aegerita]